MTLHGKNVGLRILHQLVFDKLFMNYQTSFLVRHDHYKSGLESSAEHQRSEAMQTLTLVAMP